MTVMTILTSMSMRKAFNSLFKSFYFNRTQRGGAVNKGLGQQTRLLPMARWIQRRQLFLSGYSETHMRSYLQTITPEQREYNRNWVRNLGGTIEFGQLIKERASTVALGGEDEVEERVELKFDWTIGKEGLYSAASDKANQLLNDERIR